MVYVIKYYDGSFILFNSMNKFYDFMYNNKLYIESSLDREFKEVLFRVFDSYGDDIGFFQFFYEAK